ncbi:MAG: ABC transporter ATP-binding protein [Rhizobiales bacterium]|nr:ABC transporter ATP-binding protein [Hyphomicrobiales bacterium]MBN9010586.1 ABC transporter ATP-binding protein [Hyphomicrobiales bacterium]
MNAVELDSLGLTLGRRPILRDVTLAVREGEFVGVLGPNGAGKTTLFRAILGLLKPAAGTIRVFGETARPGNAAIGYLAQSRSALPQLHLSGREFIASSIRGERYGLPILGPEGRRQLDEALDLVGAREIAARPLSAMSGGERQRLLFAQALIGHPKLLLLDEPLISLDPRRQREVVELARRLCRELGITVLFSAHELSQLFGAIDRVLYLGNGHAALGTIDEVIRPAVLSPLYGSEIEVVRANGHIFILSGDARVEEDPHLHEHHDHGHEHHDHGHS